MESPNVRPARYLSAGKPWLGWRRTYQGGKRQRATASTGAFFLDDEARRMCPSDRLTAGHAVPPPSCARYINPTSPRIAVFPWSYCCCFFFLLKSLRAFSDQFPFDLIK